ncbi:MAG: peptidoglycan-binding domain-containing protein [Microscillaceae bacterium]|nr:peptidoglycan-binding domain-containing protein [Microscillaceae bacterium]
MAFQHKYQLKVDGVMGKKTYEKLKEEVQKLNLSAPMPTFEIQDLLDVYHQKGYQVNDQQYKINLLGIRKDDMFDNMFSDRMVIFWKNENMEWEKQEFEWTTMPGTLGHGGVFNPLSVLGVTGVSVLKEGHNTWIPGSLTIPITDGLDTLFSIRFVP